MIHNWLVELDRITFSKSENDLGSHTPKRIKTHAMSAHILIARGSAACAKKLKLKRSRWEPERSCWSAALCVLFTSATWKWFIQHRTAAFAEQHNIMFTRCTCAPREREHQRASARRCEWASGRERRLPDERIRSPVEFCKCFLLPHLYSLPDARVPSLAPL